MMIVMMWLVYCVLLAGLLTAGAAAWERAARWSMRPARWGWLAALAGSVTLPWLLRLMPDREWTEVLPGGPLLLLDPVVIGSAGTVPSGWSAEIVALIVWAMASLLVIGYLGAVLYQLSRARRQWRATEVDGAPVFVTRALGPAAVGVMHASVVVPSWVLELDAELRGLLLRHEREHVHAGDPRLLLGGLMLLAAMPWNPVVWLQVLRLRNAIELDCDARVLATGADPERYGSLLLEVGRRRSSHALVMATFAEPRVFLEERIRRISRWPLERHRGRAALFTTTALLLFIGALSCDPVRIADVGEQVTPMNGMTPRVVPQDSTNPAFTPMTRRPELMNRDVVAAAIERNFPPLLRAAGISGTATVHMYIDTVGRVTRTLLSRSSGYPALDDAALSVVASMQFSSAYNRQEKVAVWVEVPITFATDTATHLDPAAARARTLRTRSEGSVVSPAARDTTARPVRSGRTSPPPENVRFTPMTKRPALQNRAEVGQALTQAYPPLLRDAGIGGRPEVWFFIDEEGTVRETHIATSSGYPALDEAALHVAKLMKFAPAENRGSRVAVWVAIPVVFTAR